MKRIGLFLGVEPQAGGMFQYTRSLLDALGRLPDDTYQVEIACASKAWQPILEHYPFHVTYLWAAKIGLIAAQIGLVACIPTPLSRFIHSFFNPVAIQLAERRCDVWIFPAQDALAFQVELPVIATVHDLMHRYEPHFPEVSGLWRSLVREHRFRNLVRWSKAILVDSEVGKRHVIESYGASADHIYPLPYVPPRSVLEYSESPDFDARYALPKKFIFYPAQFWAHKNHAALIEAAASIRDTCPDIHLVFTGGKRHEYERIISHAASLDMLGHITFSGYVPDGDLGGFYTRARAMIFPTYFGPTNIPPLEAMVFGCPVAVSGIYGMPEQLGDAALYFNQRSVEEMADTLKKLWSDDTLCTALREKGKTQITLWGEAEFSNRLMHIMSQVV